MYKNDYMKILGDKIIGYIYCKMLKDTIPPSTACNTFIWLSTISSTAATIIRIMRKGDITAVK